MNGNTVIFGRDRSLRTSDTSPRANKSIPWLDRFVLLLLASSALQAGENSVDIFVRTEVTASHQLLLITKSGRVTRIEPGTLEFGGEMLKQAAYGDIKIAANGKSVGWLAEYPNCCTSYPIPLQLQIYTGNSVYTFVGTGLPIWQWQFMTDGSQIAFGQQTVHGGMGEHYEIRTVLTNQLMAEFTPETNENGVALDDQSYPEWTTPLR